MGEWMECRNCGVKMISSNFRVVESVDATDYDCPKCGAKVTFCSM